MVATRSRGTAEEVEVQPDAKPRGRRTSIALEAAPAKPAPRRKVAAKAAKAVAEQPEEEELEQPRQQRARRQADAK